VFNVATIPYFIVCFRLLLCESSFDSTVNDFDVFSLVLFSNFVISLSCISTTVNLFRDMFQDVLLILVSFFSSSCVALHMALYKCCYSPDLTL